MKILIKVTRQILIKARFCGTEEVENIPLAAVVAFNCAVSLTVREIFKNAVTVNDSICILRENCKIDL